ncbi:MAG: hypothetical protein H8E15_10520 [Planctomycetes bacterium]|nr:hypothetical protein [Planctomycetota bacterium]
MSRIRQFFRPIKRWFRNYIYRRWDLIISVRNNEDPLVKIPRVRFQLEELTIALSKPEDEHYFRTPVWQHTHAKFVDRSENLPGYTVLMGIVDGKLVSQGPFVKGAYYDKGMRHLFDPGEDGIYWFEGETAPAWRSRGMALIGMNWLFPQLKELTGCSKIMTYYRMENRASRRLHDRYAFIPQYRLIWRQLGPLRWTRQTPVPEGY